MTIQETPTLPESLKVVFKLLPEERAAHEINSRLVASFLNEGLLLTRESPCSMQGNQHVPSSIQIRGSVDDEQHQIWIGLSKSTGKTPGGLWHQSHFEWPTVISTKSSGTRSACTPRGLATVARTMMAGKAAEREGAWEEVLAQLDSAFDNMTAWFEWAEKRPIPTPYSSAIEWEHAVVAGHPVHPMGRSFVAQHGVIPLGSSEAPSLLQPSVSFLAVDRSSLKITGPFRSILQTLVSQLQLPPTREHEMVVPCLTRQLPAIENFFPASRVLRRDAVQATAQASLRTIKLPDDLEFSFCMKLALSSTIGSVLRTITPDTTGASREISTVIADAVTEDTWICEEVAAVTGSQKDAKAARHLSCLLRRDLEPRARSLGQRLIIVSALSERPSGYGECLATLTFGLNTPASKLSWFSDFSAKLLPAVLLPALQSGIGLEAHGQNSMVRIDVKSRSIAGFCFRDFGSCKIHTPTLRRRGHHLPSVRTGSWILTENEEEVWDVLQHTVIHDQLQSIIYALQLDPITAWMVVREQLDDIFASHASYEAASRMHAYFTRPVVKYKAFFRMRLHPDPDEDIFVNTANVLHAKTPSAHRYMI